MIPRAFRSTALGLAVLPALLGACGSDATAEQMAQLATSAPDPDATRVEVVTLEASEATLTLDLPGELRGTEDALLAASQGGLVESVRVEEGDDVDKGDILVVVDRAPRLAQLAQAKAQLEQARGDLARQEKLGDLATESTLSQLRTQVASAEANVDLLSIQASRALIKAPFAGTVGAVNVSEGEVATPGSPVVRLVMLDPLEATLSVSDRDVVALEKGMAARVRTPARGDTRLGEVKHIAPVADLSTRSFLVEVSVPNPDRDLLPGMIARVGVDVALDRSAVVLPQDWIVTRLDTYGVFVEQDGIASWREVTLGDVVRGQVVIATGVTPGERLVVTGQHDLRDGDRVLIAREGTCCTDGRAVF